MLGQTANNFLKFYCKVPRPWIANPDFEPVKSAISAASGYSFPSGHTQIAMTNYCTVAYFYRNKPAVCFSMLFITVMVAISRLYLGVHYFSDVIFSVLLGLIIMCAYFFYHIKKSASYLLVPYILWVIFAGYLNLGITFLN